MTQASAFSDDLLMVICGVIEEVIQVRSTVGVS